MATVVLTFTFVLTRNLRSSAKELHQAHFEESSSTQAAKTPVSSGCPKTIFSDMKIRLFELVAAVYHRCSSFSGRGGSRRIVAGPNIVNTKNSDLRIKNQELRIKGWELRAKG